MSTPSKRSPKPEAKPEAPCLSAMVQYAPPSRPVGQWKEIDTLANIGKYCGTYSLPYIAKTIDRHILPEWLFLLKPGDKVLQMYACEEDHEFLVSYGEILPVNEKALDEENVEKANPLVRQLCRLVRLFDSEHPEGFEDPIVLNLWDIAAPLTENEFGYLKECGFPETAPDLIKLLLEEHVNPDKPKAH